MAQKRTGKIVTKNILLIRFSIPQPSGVRWQTMKTWDIFFPRRWITDCTFPSSTTIVLLQVQQENSTTPAWQLEFFTVKCIYSYTFDMLSAVHTVYPVFFAYCATCKYHNRFFTLYLQCIAPFVHADKVDYHSICEDIRVWTNLESKYKIKLYKT